MINFRPLAAAVISLGLAYSVVTPAMGACSAATIICGTIKTTENNVALTNWIVELRDQYGKILSTTKTTTAATINYQFPGLAAGSYFVDAVAGRSQYVSPLYLPVFLDGLTLTPTSDFAIGGIQETISFSQEVPGTYIVISTFQWTNANPPETDQTSFGLVNAYSRTADFDGTATIVVSPNFKYYVACWKPTGTGASLTYSFATTANPITGSGTGGIFQPQDTRVAVCPHNE